MILSSMYMDYVSLVWLDHLPYRVLLQEIITLHGRGCGRTRVELRVLASANVLNPLKTQYISLFNCLIALEAKCCPCKGSSNLLRVS